MSGNLNVAIIGGNFGRKVHLPAFQSIPNVNIVGVYTSKDNIKDVICDPKIDAITVAVPPFASFDILKLAIEQKKHIFTEKPLALNLENANILNELLTDDIITAVNFEIAESRIVKTLANILATKRVEGIRWFRLGWRIPSARSVNHPNHWKEDKKRGGGVLYNFCSHLFHLLPIVLGEDILSIETEFCEPNEMSLVVNLGECSGTIYIKSSPISSSNFFLNVECENNYYSLNNSSVVLKNFVLKDQTTYPDFIIDKENDLSDKDGRVDLTSSLAARFIDGIINKTQISPRFSDGLKVQKLIDQVINRE